MHTQLAVLLQRCLSCLKHYTCTCARLCCHDPNPTIQPSLCREKRGCGWSFRLCSHQSHFLVSLPVLNPYPRLCRENPETRLVLLDDGLQHLPLVRCAHCCFLLLAPGLLLVLGLLLARI